ncbi:MAG: hypothetical protein RL625_1639, partial [Gemmatimonadota bacterium]
MLCPSAGLGYIPTVHGHGNALDSPSPESARMTQQLDSHPHAPQTVEIVG